MAHGCLTSSTSKAADGFFRKLRSAIAAARSQIESHTTTGLTYVIVIPDDFALDNYGSYRHALAEFATAEEIVDVYVKVDLRFNRNMRLRGRLTRV